MEVRQPTAARTTKMKAWTKDNMRLLSKWRAQKREASAAPADAAGARTRESQPAVDGPPCPLVCCGGSSVEVAVARGTPADTREEGRDDDGYYVFDEAKARAMERDEPQNLNQQLVTATPNGDQKVQEQPHVLKELFLLFRQRSWKKKLLTFLVVATIVPVFLDLFVFRTGHVTDFLDHCLEWIALHPIFGVWLHVGLLTLASLVFVPPSLLIFAAGFTFQAIWGAWGILIALLTSFLGSATGGLLGYWRAHYMARDFIEILMRRYRIIMAVDAALVRNPLRVMMLLRLNCLIPFGVLNYVFGVSGVGWEEFLLALAGIVPWHLLLISLGASAETMYDENTDTALLDIILMAMGIAFSIIGLAILWKFAKKELQKSVDATPPSTAAGYRAHVPDAQPWRSRSRPMPPPSVEEADLGATDYWYTQYLGEPATGAGADDGEYDRSQLTWSEIILDDFS